MNSSPAAPPPSGHSSHSRLEALLRQGRFVVTAEMAPPDSADPEDVLAAAQPLVGAVDAINITDGSSANVHISSVAASAILVRAGLSPIMQMTCRDRNRIAMQADILGAAALGVDTVLCLTGDGVQAGDHPEAKPVYDLDGLTLVQLVRTLRDEKRFLSGRPLRRQPDMFIGAPENPFAPPLDARPQRLLAKINAGAQFVQTQYCYDVSLLRAFMDRVRDLGLDRRVFILVGVGPLASAKAARWMCNHVPGVHIPEAVISRLEGAQDPAAEGRRLCVELMQQIREIEGVAGLHVMAYRQEKWVGELIRQSGIAADRR